MRLTSFKGHRHPARLMRRIHFKKACIGWERIEALDRVAAQFVTPDAAQNGSVIAQTPSHYREVGRRSAQPGPLGQEIPEQFANSQNQVRLLQSHIPEVSP
jgi:hypothetical protein